MILKKSAPSMLGITPLNSSIPRPIGAFRLKPLHGQTLRFTSPSQKKPLEAKAMQTLAPFPEFPEFPVAISDVQEMDLQATIQKGFVFVRCIDDAFDYFEKFHKKHNETCVEAEIRKLSRESGFPTLKSVANETGLLSASTTLIGQHTEIAGFWGYGLVNPPREQIKAVYKGDGHSPTKNRDEVQARASDCSLESLKEYVDAGRNALMYNEVLISLDLKSPISFVFGQVGHEMEALYCKEKFKAIAGLDLPIFQYSKSDYPKHYQLNMKDIARGLKRTRNLDMVVTLLAYYKDNPVLLDHFKTWIDGPALKTYLSGNMHYSNYVNAFQLMEALNIPLEKEFLDAAKQFISNLNVYAGFDRQNSMLNALRPTLHMDEILHLMQNNGVEHAVFRDMESIQKHILNAGLPKHQKQLLLQRNVNLAIAENNASLAHQLLDAGAVPSPHPDISQLLRHDPQGLLKRILAMGVDVNPAGNRTTALHLCANTGNIPALNLLLKKGAPIDAKNSRGNTALLEACENGRAEVALTLMKHGANANLPNNEGKTPHDAMLELASGKYSPQPHGLPAFAYAERNSHGKTALHLAVENGNLEYILRVLKKTPPEALKYKDSSGFTPLDTAIKHYRKDICMHLLQYAPEGHSQRDIWNNTPLHREFIIGNPQSREDLIQTSPDEVFATRGSMDRYPLHCILRYEHHEQIEEALRKTPDEAFATRDLNGFTPLHYACEMGKLELVRQIFERTPQSVLGMTDGTGKTPLHYACSQADAEMVALFVEKTPDAAFSLADKWKQTPFHYALHFNRPQLVEMLISRTPKEILETSDYNGNTHLHIACERKDPEIVHLLLDKAPDTIFQRANKEGDTPLHFACERGDLEIVRRILEKVPTNVLGLRNNVGKTPNEMAKNPKVRNLLEAEKLRRTMLEKGSINRTSMDAKKRNAITERGF